MRVIMTGQMFYAADRAGPMLIITALGHNGSYQAKVVSYMSGETLAKEGFATVGEAVEWCYGHSEW